MEHPWLAALALMLVFEGLMPTVAPQLWRQVLVYLSNLNDQRLRTLGLVMLISGGLLFYGLKP